MQCARATRIQKLMRGIIGRSFIRDYRRERARLYAIHAASSLKVQRAYRAWRGRKVGKAKKLELYKSELMKGYLESHSAKKDSQKKERMKNALLVSYKHERRQEEAARVTGILEYRGQEGEGGGGGGRLTNYGQSNYGKHRVDKDMSQYYRAQHNTHGIKMEKKIKKKEKARFAEKLSKERHPIYGNYFKKELEERHTEFVQEEVKQIHPFMNKGSRKIKDQIRALQAKAVELSELRALRGNRAKSVSMSQLPEIRR